MYWDLRGKFETIKIPMLGKIKNRKNSSIWEMKDTKKPTIGKL